MKLRIDHDADALSLRLADTKIIESEQVGPGVIVDFDAKNRNVIKLSRNPPCVVTRPRHSLRA